jgi:tRNA (guanine37-N1)-methyltransferase
MTGPKNSPSPPASRSLMQFHVITLFPEMIETAARFGVVGQAIKEEKIRLATLSPRKFTSNVHQTIDDRPFGGGDGMIMMAEPTAQALESILAELGERAPSAVVRVIHLSPRGERLTDAKVRELGKFTDLILIASRYGGIDQRFLNQFVDEEISVGDYVLSGGELPALALIDAVSRVLPGVLGNETSPEEESFSQATGLLEHPQFTRPREWRGDEVPADLLSGNHAGIEEWKDALSLFVTLERRPDILTQDRLDKITPKQLERLRKIFESLSARELEVAGISNIPLVRERLMSLKGTRR